MEKKGLNYRLLGQQTSDIFNFEVQLDSNIIQTI